MADRTFYEFFAGGGMARLGLGGKWTCLLANDIDPKKAEAYAANFDDKDILCVDIAKLSAKLVPGSATLAWASFPCQDLSLAGNRLGLIGERSGTFWGFWSIINKLKLAGRHPAVLVLENVCGLLTSNRGQDFHEICGAIASLGYNFGALVVDAIHFLPQSRPRLFIICTQVRLNVPSGLLSDGPNDVWHTPVLKSVAESLPHHLQSKWIWWNLPQASESKLSLAQLVFKRERGFQWHSKAQTEALMKMMTPINRKKIAEAQKCGKRVVGTIYKRKRVENGKRVQRAEVRFDGIAGCLRTPSGGSSRQILMVVTGKRIISRLISIREAARLMGVSDEYEIPANYNDGYRIFGDGVAVPVVAHIANNLLNPLADAVASASNTKSKLAA